MPQGVNWSIGYYISPDDSGGGSSPQNVLPVFCIRLLQFENVHVPLSCMDSHEQYTVDSVLPRY